MIWGEAFTILVMCAVIALLIWFINFVERNLPDALGEACDWPALPDELSADDEGCVGGRDGLDAASRATQTNDVSHPSQGAV